MKKKKAYNSVLDSDDSTSGSDNNCAIMQHNKWRIAIKSDEGEDIQEEDTPLILYQLETVPVPIVDKNTKADSYTQLQIKKPCLALNTEMYINIRQQVLATCKRIGYKFYCEELFIVRHKSIHSYESTIYFDLDKDIIKRNCDLKFYYNNTDITLTVLNRGNEIILANWPNDKHIICTFNNDIPIRIPTHPYILVNRSILGNCGIEAENNFLLESLAACHDANTNLVMYFMVNTAFANLTKDLKFHNLDQQNYLRIYLSNIS